MHTDFEVVYKCIYQLEKVILYKPPGEKRGKILVAAAAAWAAYPQDLDNAVGHSFVKALESVTATHPNKHFFAYNNAAAGVVGVKTKSNSKDTTVPADAAAWIVHTVPGYPKPKVAYTFPASEYANGHMLICLTIAESQIEPIAVALFVASPFIYYNDVPDAEVSTRPTLKKLLNGETPIHPPFSSKQTIKTQAGAPVSVQIFSKSGRSKYEIYQKIISKQLKKTIKVWSRRDKKLKANCKIPGRHILLVSSPISVDGQASSLEKDVTNWLIPENGDIFCAVDKPYAISQKYEPAVAVCMQLANIFARFNTIAAKVDSCPVVLYKPPGEKRGKILVPPGDAWADNPQDLENAAAHSFAKALESVAQAHNDKKFFAYNNAASGVVILDIRPGTDEAAWIVHTVPGYPKPKVAYTFPASEYANGHLLICLTIAESQIEPIAVALFVASPFIHYNDVPDAEVSTRPTLKKLLNGETPIHPPFSSKQTIKTQAGAPVSVQIFSKSGRSKYEIYQKIISKQLKKTIKVWSRRDKKLKANCKIPGRHILLVSSPISVDNKASSLEKDVTNWLIPENGDIFCAVDKPYAISQKYEPAVAQIFLPVSTLLLPKAILYKPPGEKAGKILVPAGGAWAPNPQNLENARDHSFAKALESVVGNHPAKRVVILDNTPQADSAAWIVHTVPGYPIPKVAYTFPASEYANGHLLICLTIAESQIEPIAVALFVASPFIHYNDVPDAEVRTRPTLKKLLNGETPIHPPFSSKQAIKTQAGDPVSVQIFSKSGRSKYEIYQKIISRQLKKTIKVWSRRDKKLKANCKIPGRHILLVSSPISVDNQASSLEKDVTNWLIPENGDIFCAVDKPYAISQKYEPAVAVCMQLANIFARFNTIAAKVDSCS
ncbi:Deoxyribonuclease-2-alpha [Trichinella spiralis]|uniref:Deoxyribonuclease-2-alpha n=1 Tax=Trichinella spiralis TaxID=6334 RepID=A0A0V1AQR4_TRISP|nr:Deoxyribonuclease-2-alpha [Trichinella spiralis]